jgi:hypothetical protein
LLERLPRAVATQFRQLKAVRSGSDQVSGCNFNALLVFEKPETLVNHLERQAGVAGDVSAE